MHIINKIFDSFEKENIRYCHFKSNQHLKESFEGESDFDILVDNNKKSECINILLLNQCKQFEPEYIGEYPGVENWLAFDSESGVIYHIHLHYQLITGKSLVKDYVLPWNQFILETSIKSNEYSLYTSDPNVELILLTTRLVLKSKIRHFIKSILGIYRMPYDMQIEFNYLKERVDNNKLQQCCIELFGIIDHEKFFEIISQNRTIKAKHFIQLNFLVRKKLRNYRRMGFIRSLLLSKFIRGKDLIKKVLSRKLGRIQITKKVTSSGGKIIAFIGVDGSGKSTVSNIIIKWLSRKIEAKKYYMGTGDGEKNAFASLITFLKGISKKRNTNKRNSIDFSRKEISKIKFTQEPLNYIKKYLHALVIYSVVKDNRKKIIRMHRYRLNGGISILDRYPQLEQESINDGLKLNRYAQILNSKIISKLSDKERDLMAIVESIYPDIIFRLKVSPEVSVSRKPDEHFNFDAIKFKTHSVNKLKFTKSLVFDVDASNELSKEILEIQKIIWEKL